ncbi:MAG: hypothetical protein ACREK5_06465 [Gemmatimonadota bacterium]
MNYDSGAITALSVLGTVCLAILSGAGGAALLELYYKPRRDRRRAAALLLSEILLNADLALLQAHVRQRIPRKMPSDFSFSTMAWEACSEMVSELPVDLIKRVVIIYNRYQAGNRILRLYTEASRDLESLPTDSEGRIVALEAYLNSAVDAFNANLDKTIDDAKEVAPYLIRLAKISEKEENQEPLRDYEKLVDGFLKEREQRLEYPHCNGT